MSKENVETLRSVIQAMEQGDIESGLSYFSEGVVFEPLVAGPYYGHEGVVQQWVAFFEEFDGYWFEPDELIDAGDQVLMYWRHGGVGKASGIRVDTEGGSVFTFEGGRISRVRVYADRAEARAVAGLPA